MEPTGRDFDFDGVFDEDYLYFYEQVLTDERSDHEAELVSRLLDLEPGMVEGCQRAPANTTAGAGSRVAPSTVPSLA